MRLKFGFSNDTPPVDFQIDEIQATPVELLVNSTGTRQTQVDALNLYVRALDYLFRGVSNYATGKITNISVEKSWFGKVEKNQQLITWEAISDKSFVIVYDISINSLTENMYVADAIKVGGKAGSKKVDPVWIKELLTPKPMEKQENIIKSISIATEFLTKYRLTWGFKGKNDLTVLNRRNRPVQIENISDDETFIIVKLLHLLMSRGTHLGVFLIDCRGFSDRSVRAFLEIAEVFFGDPYIFLYNVNPNIKVNRKQLVLPNFLANGVGSR